MGPDEEDFWARLPATDDSCSERCLLENKVI